jgi:hypothetical protein
VYAKNRLLGLPNTVAAARGAFDQRCTAMTFTLSGFGVSSGSDDSAAGFGFKAGTYKTGFGSPTQGSIQEQSALFGKQDSYSSEKQTTPHCSALNSGRSVVSYSSSTSS